MATIASTFQRLGLLPRTENLASPYQWDGLADGSGLVGITLGDLYGAENVPQFVTRDVAMAIAPVAKARQVLTGTVAPLPLVAVRKGEVLADQPRWLQHTDGMLSPTYRMTWTLDDMLFHGESLWRVRRGAPTGEGLPGPILDAWHIPYSSWEVTHEGHIKVLGEYVPASSCIYFPGHVEGLLTRGRVTLLSAIATEQSVQRRAATPIPLVEIHQTDADSPLSQAEADAYVAKYNARRKDPDGVTMFTPAHIEVRTHGDKADSGHLIEARNALRLDIANHTGLPASVLEGSLSTASLTYSTNEGAKENLASLGLGPYMDTLSGRLSQDDVTPQGTAIRFDAEYLFNPNPSPTGPVTED